MISGGEIFMIFLVILLLFGSKGIPDAVRTIGKILREFQKATGDIKREFENSPVSGIRQEFEGLKKSVEENVQKISTEVDSAVGNIENEAGKIADNTNQGLNQLENNANELADNTNKALNHVKNEVNEFADNTNPESNDYGYDYYRNSGYGYEEMANDLNQDRHDTATDVNMEPNNSRNSHVNDLENSHVNDSVETSDDQKLN